MGSVLIVDNEADVIQALKLRLQTMGYEAMTASDGAEALELLDRTNVDLILTDLMMPNLDGLELTRRVRQDPKWVGVHVLLFSCLDDPVSRSLALELGALDYLLKDAGTQAIVSRIQEILAASGRPESAPPAPAGDRLQAETTLVSQLRALSNNLGSSPTAGAERFDAETGNVAHSPSQANDLRNLAKALERVSSAAGNRPKPN